jgi:anti-sigma regulatory factor (Ser/Thr protein kinase)
VVVGDVVGHGLAPAAIMAQLRTAVRAYAADGAEPAEVLARVNHLMWHLGPLSMTTLVYLVLDPATESLQIVNAGHPPPLIVEPGAEPRFLEAPRGVALGATAMAAYTAGTLPLPTGSTVLLYTDGLVERRGEPIDAGFARLKALVTQPHDVDNLCASIVESLVPAEPSDDVALIAVRIPPLGDSLHTSWKASPDSLAGVRYLLGRWLRGRGATRDEIYDITVATQEACTNAIEHAYAPGPAGFELTAELVQGRVRVAVRDRGNWRAPRGTNRGRGLPMMRALMDSVDVRETGEGTEVVLERMLGRRP